MALAANKIDSERMPGDCGTKEQRHGPRAGQYGAGSAALRSGKEDERQEGEAMTVGMVDTLMAYMVGEGENGQRNPG